MTDENEKREGVYGENLPPEEDTNAPDIREQMTANTDGVDADLEQTRQEMAEETGSGGMGRQETPESPGATQGRFGGDEPAEPSPS